MREILKTYPIGIDMDDRCVTAAQYRKTRHGISLRELACQPLTSSASEDDGELVAALKSVRSSGSFKGRRVVVNIPFQDLSVFPVQFLLGERDDPEEAILREAVKFLPYPLEEAILDYPSFTNQAGTCTATVVAVHRQVMTRWLGIMKSAGLTAEVMEFSFSSLLRLHRGLFPNDGRAELLCHIGRTRSLLAVANGEELLCFSETPWGIEPLSNKIRTQLELPNAAAEAATLLKDYGLAYSERAALTKNTPDGSSQDSLDMYRVIFQIIAPTVDEFMNECHRTIGYLLSLQDQAVFGKIYLYGLSDRISHLDRYLEKQTGIPTESVDALENLGYAKENSPSCFPEGISSVLALGLAMREVSWP